MDPDKCFENIINDCKLLARMERRRFESGVVAETRQDEQDLKDLKDALAENLDALSGWLKSGGFGPDPFPWLAD